MKFNRFLIVILSIVVFDVVGIGLIMLVLLGFLCDLVYLNDVIVYYGILLVLYVLM